jgi:hypothetical protein
MREKIKGEREEKDMTNADVILLRYRIVNRCRRLKLVVMQRGCMRQEILAPGTSIGYAWEEPAAPRKQHKVVLKVKKSEE